MFGGVVKTTDVVKRQLFMKINRFNEVARIQNTEGPEKLTRHMLS
jgi:hypothetical protein